MEVIVTSKAELSELVRATLADTLAQLQPTQQSTTGNNRPLDIKGAAEFTGFAESTIYTLVQKKAIPFHKRNGRLFFFCDELTQWIKDGDKPGTNNALQTAESRLRKRKG